MREEQLAIVKGLVAVAWADGTFASKETEMIDAVLSAFEASDDEKSSVKEYAKTKRDLSHIELQELSAEDRRQLLAHAVVLSFVDGEQAAEELTFLTDLAKTLRIPDSEANALLAASTLRAKRHLKLLTPTK